MHGFLTHIMVWWFGSATMHGFLTYTMVWWFASATMHGFSTHTMVWWFASATMHVFSTHTMVWWFASATVHGFSTHTMVWWFASATVHGFSTHTTRRSMPAWNVHMYSNWRNTYCPKNILNLRIKPSHPGLEQMQRYLLSGQCKQKPNILLYQLEPWQARFLCKGLIIFSTEQKVLFIKMFQLYVRVCATMWSRGVLKNYFKKI